jgi:hypothetical protein
MKFLIFPALLFLAACQSTEDTRRTSDSAYVPYHRIVETNFSGERIVSWIAEGKIRHRDNGLAFRAVERTVYRPIQLNYHYPLGRPMWASASNIVICPVEKPVWMAYATPESFCFSEQQTVVTRRDYK